MEEEYEHNQKARKLLIGIALTLVIALAFSAIIVVFYVGYTQSLQRQNLQDRCIAAGGYPFYEQEKGRGFLVCRKIGDKIDVF